MRRVWIIVRLAYLYLQYFLVGLVEDGFQIQKGGLLCDLGHFAAAAKAYERALRDTQAPFVQASLGYCYLCMGIPDKAVHWLSKAYERRASLDVGMTLFQALRANGELERAGQLAQELEVSQERLSPQARQVLAEFEAKRAV